jgi:hypothetical protein
MEQNLRFAEVGRTFLQHIEAFTKTRWRTGRRLARATKILCKVSPSSGQHRGRATRLERATP